MFVVRDTFHPQEDLNRNWSSFAGGWDNELAGRRFNDEDEAAIADENVSGSRREYRFHPAYCSFVCVHYEGLGAFMLNAETIEEALSEAAEINDGLACTMDAGDGHFFAEDVITFHKVREGRYVFELK